MDSANNNNSSSTDRQNVCFKFTKTTSKKLTGNRLDEDFNQESKTEKDYVISVAKSGIKSTVPKEDERDLIIPLIRKNNWRASDGSVKDKESTIEELAIKELLKETTEKNEQWEKREFQNYTVTIPLIMQNKVPEGYETDEKMDVSLRPDESKLEDYEKVPVEQYGLAILRGMGWKEGDPIGANSKKCVEPVQVQLRPKGLGLGADTSALKKTQEKKKEGEKLDLVKDAYVQITQGSNKGSYGQVLGLDEENGRAIIKLSGSENAVTFPEFYINVVSKKEYEKESRVINRSSYEKYKAEKEQKEKQELQSKETDKESRQSSKMRKENDKNGGKRNQDSKPSKHAYSNELSKSTKKRRHSRERSIESKISAKHKSEKSWVRPQLKVRLIDDKYKKGKYFNQKLVVVDVLSPRNCTCKTEDGKYLEDISPSMLETVIPRTEPSYVMIVQGKYSGELCTILKKDKSSCIATIQFLSDRDQALKIEYDSICEYVGDVSFFD